jgi:ADP-ribose pyrophosphatase YjhB (NUDIX family)
LNYCSNCGSKDILWIIPEGETHHRFICDNCDTIHYQNPKVVVGCIPRWGNKILLCRRAIEPRKGFWNLPGGYLENGESLIEGAGREAFEETNAKVKIGKLISIFTIPTINQVMIHFAAELESDDFSTTEESSELALYAPEELPWDELAFNSNDFALKAYLEFVDKKESRVKMFTYRK